MKEMSAMFSATPEVISAIQAERTQRAENARLKAALRRMGPASRSRGRIGRFAMTTLRGRRAGVSALLPASRSV